jgi:hypothetical protein
LAENENREPGSQPGLPLLYVAVLAGFMAAVCLSLALGLMGAASTPLWFSIAFLAPASACATFVMVCFALPMHALIVQIRFVSPWTYAAGMLAIVGFVYIVLFGNDTKAISDPIGSLFFLVPIVAIPSGLFFYALVHRTHSVAPFDRRDAVIVAAWFGAWIMMLVTFRMTHYFVIHHTAPDPLHARVEILWLAGAYGTGMFMLSGVIAGLARLKSCDLDRSLRRPVGWYRSVSQLLISKPHWGLNVFVSRSLTKVLSWTGISAREVKKPVSALMPPSAVPMKAGGAVSSTDEFIYPNQERHSHHCGRERLAPVVRSSVSGFRLD